MTTLTTNKNYDQYSNKELFERMLNKFGIDALPEYPNFLFITSRNRYFGNYGRIESLEDISRDDIQYILSNYDRTNIIFDDGNIMIHDGNGKVMKYEDDEFLYDVWFTGRVDHKYNAAECMESNGSWHWLSLDNLSEIA